VKNNIASVRDAASGERFGGKPKSYPHENSGVGVFKIVPALGKT
jgi:hypothetical protein